MWVGGRVCVLVYVLAAEQLIPFLSFSPFFFFRDERPVLAEMMQLDTAPKVKTGVHHTLVFYCPENCFLYLSYKSSFFFFIFM